MDLRVKIALYVVLGLVTAVLGYQFTAQYAELQKQEARGLPSADEEPEEYGAEPIQALVLELFWYGGAFLLSSIGLALLVGRDIGNYCATRFARFLQAEEADELPDQDYEAAEREWANGNYLKAIEMLREHLQNDPRAQHAAVRIAEIYENNLQNYLAAALEYEEVLKQRLPPERWGWIAIHLCNLYSSKLNQPQKAVELLHRIASEHGNTSAGTKARERLVQIGELKEEQPEPTESPSPSTPDSPPPKAAKASKSSKSSNSSNLPPGFTPKG